MEPIAASARPPGHGYKIQVAVYVDEPIWSWRGRRWCHLTADSTAELHEFAARLGLRRASFQSKPGRPWHDHYDLPIQVRERALRMGATPLTTREMGRRQATLRRSRQRAGIDPLRRAPRREPREAGRQSAG